MAISRAYNHQAILMSATNILSAMTTEGDWEDMLLSNFKGFRRDSIDRAVSLAMELDDKVHESIKKRTEDSKTTKTAEVKHGNN